MMRRWYVVWIVGALATLTSCSPDHAAPQVWYPTDESALDDQDAATILETGRHGLSEVTSVHFTADSEKYSLDLVASDETHCHGSVASEKGRMDYVSDGITFWLNGNEQFWENSDSSEVGPTSADRWVAMAYQTAVATDISQACTVWEVTSFLSWDPSEVDMTVGETTTVEGVPAVELSGTIQGKPTQVWVSVVEPYAVVKLDISGEGIMQFNDFNAEVALEVPEDAIDIEDSMS